ncbi:MAG: ATPase [Flavobacteriales bacterium]
MILIADSGNSRCKWALVEPDGTVIRQFKTEGINPYFHTTEKIKATLWEEDEALRVKSKVTHVFFYGAGCSSVRLNGIVEKALKDFFLEASIAVDHDLVSAAYATYSGSPVISCILGTGSNSAYFDGTKTSEVIPNLAYILGDEASGCYFGKILLRDFFYDFMPNDLSRTFNAEYKLTSKELNDRVYNSGDPNVFLAGFMPFLGMHKDNEYVKNMMIEGFRDFLKFQVKCFPNWAEVEVSFLGSIAVHFESLLAQACEIEGVQLGEIVFDPMKNLIEYHLKYVIPEKIST